MTPTPQPIVAAATAATRRRSAFTLIELLVVIGIISLLIGILIPTIKHVRIAGYNSSTTGRVQAIMGAIENYFQTFGAYPGPFDDANVQHQYTPPNFVAAPSTNGQDPFTVLTSTENMVVGLLGGPKYVVANLSGGTPPIVYDPTVDYVQVGQGPFSFNPLQPKRYGPFIDSKTAGLQKPEGNGQWQNWKNGTNDMQNHQFCFDSRIPEFTDTFPDAMPILYMRAKRGATGTIFGAPVAATGNAKVAVTSAAWDPTQLAPYAFPAPKLGSGSAAAVSASGDAYTGTPDPQVIKDWLAADKTTPAPHKYFAQPGNEYTPREKDHFMLITAGPDRKYMTADDTINGVSAQ